MTRNGGYNKSDNAHQAHEREFCKQMGASSSGDHTRS